jgi:hypothetical protein
MKTVEKYRWKIRWAGRSTTTRAHFTEAEIRDQHPDAVRVDESRIEVVLPETEAEILASQRPALRSTASRPD